MISIIIIVKNDPGIDTTLSYLARIKKPEKTEIIIVDASDGDLDYIKDKNKFVRWYDYNSPDSKKITIPQQRNLGIKKSKGDIIVFLDAGCIPSHNWLVNLLEPIYKDNEYIVVGRTFSEGKPTIHDQSNILNKNKKYLDESPTLNIAIKRSAFDKVGIFDESFECGEDIDFCWRARDLGFRIRYIKVATVTHNWGNWKQDLKRSFWYGTARVMLYKKHRNRIKNIFTNDTFAIIYPLFIIGSIISIKYPIYFLLLIIPLVKNRKFHPFKVVLDHLIYGIGILYKLASQI